MTSNAGTTRRLLPLAAAIALVALGLIGPLRAAAAPASPAQTTTTTAPPSVQHGDVQPDATAAGNQMTAGKATILGLVEGITEFLPISSTGHLLVTQRLLGIGDTPETKAAADAYAIAIQAGAILAVVLLYWSRLRDMAFGLVGRDEGGRRTLVAIVLAFIPAAVIGLTFESAIKEHLLEVGPVIAAWVVGALVIFFLAPRWEDRPGGTTIDQITIRQGLIIGVAQCLALWPGTSRSLVTILAALAVGLSLSAAVEFSFLLGLVTLGAATAYEALKDGNLMLDAYGWVDPLIGLVVAFVAAAIAIRWMVGYLQHHSLAIFGWYRLAVAAIAAVLLWTGAV